MNANLTLEEYATILAQAVHRAASNGDEVLLNKGISAAAFESAHRQLARELAESTERRTGVLAMRFCAAFGKALLDLGPLHLAPGQLAEGSPVAAGPTVSAVPSFLLDASSKEAPVFRAPPITHVSEGPDVDATLPPSPVLQPATPFVKERSTSPATLPLERFAEVNVTLASAENREEVLRRFQLTEETWRTTAAAWGEKITANTELRAQYIAHVQQLKEKLANTQT